MSLKEFRQEIINKLDEDFFNINEDWLDSEQFNKWVHKLYCQCIEPETAAKNIEKWFNEKRNNDRST